MRRMENGKKMEWKITEEIVATTSLPVNRLTATDCNAAARAKNVKHKFGVCFSSLSQGNGRVTAQQGFWP